MEIYSYKIIIYTPVWDESKKVFKTRQSIYYSKYCSFFETVDLIETMGSDPQRLPVSRHIPVLFFQLESAVFIEDEEKTGLEAYGRNLTIPKDSEYKVIVVDLRDRKILYESK